MAPEKRPPRSNNGTSATPPKAKSTQANSTNSGSPSPSPHKWEFRPRFRRGSFGWRSKSAIQRVRQAVTEIQKVARRDALLGAEGAVLFLEKVSPALENVDGSSGSIGTAVNKAVSALVEVIVAAPADPSTRAAWLERLISALEADEMPWIDLLGDEWGRLCASPESASGWADHLLPATQRALVSTPGSLVFFYGTVPCLSALHAAGRFDELVSLFPTRRFWPYARWAARALFAQGKKHEALRFAEECRRSAADDHGIDRFCEEVLLSSGLIDEAYERYGTRPQRSGTYLAWFRAVAKRYPQKDPARILEDLVRASPGEEGKWFAAAKSLKLFDEAIELANRAPCSPQTLTRAARDFREKNPAFAVEAGVAALRWLTEGYGYEVTGLDVHYAFNATLGASKVAGSEAETLTRVRKLVLGGEASASFVKKVLGPYLGEN